jgi:hypothetical protein
LALLAGCGGDDDNGALSYDDTGEELAAICQEYDTAAAEGDLTGEAAQDATVLADVNEQTAAALDEVRALDVHEELAAARDEFVSLGEASLERGENLQQIAESGDQRAYLKKIREFARQSRPLGAETDAAASRLGAPECGQN